LLTTSMLVSRGGSAQGQRSTRARDLRAAEPKVRVRAGPLALSGGPARWCGGRVSTHPSLEPPPEALVTSAVAEAVGLSKVYGEGEASVTALDDVTVEFARGRLTAIMGPSGSGKSTLMHCMAALDTPTSGRVVIDGVDISHLKDKALTMLRRDRLGFVFQAYNLIPTLTARENITLPLDIAGHDVDATWFDTVIDTLGIRDRLSHRPDQLSGGQQQRVACARALVSRPAIVFADEPTGNLDSHASAEILSFLRTSVDEFGQSIVMVTHDPSSASYADRVLFLADGRIVDDVTHPTMQSVVDRIQDLAQPVAAGR
jgi:putative ABC transport system ATP-binding protein